jgi:hypothetical protein
MSGETTTVMPFEDAGGNLVAQRFTAAGGHDRQRVLAVEDAVDHALLAVAQLLDAEDGIEQARMVLRRTASRPLCRSLGSCRVMMIPTVKRDDLNCYRTQPTVTVGAH